MKGFKTFGCLLALLLAVVILLPATAEAADVAINSTNFPDKGFRAYVKKEFDKNKDGKLSASEIKKADWIYYVDKGCTSMKGIELFPNLKGLYCQNNKLTSLDVSKNTKLEHLSCSGNKIIKLDISNCPWIIRTYIEPSEYYYPDVDDDEGACEYWLAIPEDDYEEETDDPGHEYWFSVDESTKVVCKPLIETQPKARKVTEGEKATFKVKALGEGLTYQWYYKKPGASSFKKVAAASGKKATFTVTATAAKNGYQYRCKVTNASGSRTSKTVKLTVCALPEITSPTKATSRTIKIGDTTTFKVKATGAAKYQWYFRTSSTGSWKKITAESGKTANYELKVATRHNGYQYRCKVSNAAGGYVYSQIFSLKTK